MTTPITEPIPKIDPTTQAPKTSETRLSFTLPSPAEIARIAPGREERLFLLLSIFIGLISGLLVVSFRMAIEWLNVLLLGSAPALAAEEPSGCDKFKWPIEHERAALTAPDRVKLTTGGEKIPLILPFPFGLFATRLPQPRNPAPL